MSDNRELSKLLADQEVTLTQQHDELQRLSDSHVDHSKLLESMQSDKTALSRATAQNRELKNQLAELQNGFIKMVSIIMSRFIQTDFIICRFINIDVISIRKFI